MKPLLYLTAGVLMFIGVRKFFSTDRTHNGARPGGVTTGSRSVVSPNPVAEPGFPPKETTTDCADENNTPPANVASVPKSGDATDEVFDTAKAVKA